MIKKLKGIKTPFKIGLLAAVIVIIAAIAFTSVAAFAADPSPTPTPSPAATPTTPSTTPAPSPALHSVRGKVTSIASDKSSIVIQNGSQASVTVNLDQNTQYFKGQVPLPKDRDGMFQHMPYYPGTPRQYNHMPWNKNQRIQIVPLNRGQSASVGDIAIGDNIVARVDSKNLAKQVVIEKPSTIKTVQGTLTEITGNSLTITPTSGSAVKLTWDGNTRFNWTGGPSLQTGKNVIVTYDSQTMIAKVVSEVRTTPAPSPSKT